MKLLSANNAGTEVVDPQAPATGGEPSMNDSQLELTLAGASPRRPLIRARGRARRANWWFARMREIVDGACDWQPAPPPRPEQTWFPNAFRQPATASGPELSQEERQICE